MPCREVLGLVGRCEGFAEYGFAPDLWVGCVGRVYAFRKCRLIPHHQSLTRQTACSFLPPKGKPSVRWANMANVANVAYMADMSNIFELWFAFTIRPHPSPTATPSPSKGKASDRSANLKKSALGIRHFRHLHLKFQAFVRFQHFKVKTKEVCI